MIVEKIKISKLKPAPYNARQSTKKQELDLRASLEKFGVVEPIIFNKQTGFIVGGHFRIRELKKLGYKEVECVIVDLSPEDEKELNIRLNANTGEWDWDLIANEWDAEQLDEWGLDMPNIQNTEKLSELKFESIYFEPENKPNVTLKDCADFTKFNAKLEAIEKSELSEEQKETLQIFAYRFIKIDFENVANYYYFNASEEEKKVIERLRLVLCDNGLNGFIEDDILKAHQVIEEWDENL